MGIWLLSGLSCHPPADPTHCVSVAPCSIFLLHATSDFCYPRCKPFWNDVLAQLPFISLWHVPESFQNWNSSEIGQEMCFLMQVLKHFGSTLFLEISKYCQRTLRSFLSMCVFLKPKVTQKNLSLFFTLYYLFLPLKLSTHFPKEKKSKLIACLMQFSWLSQFLSN